MANETITFDLDADHDWTANKRRLEKAMLERAVELHGNNYAATGRYLGITKVAARARCWVSRATRFGKCAVATASTRDRCGRAPTRDAWRS
jgi:hypothetical protein